MMKILLISFLMVPLLSEAYIPTVESLFRRGTNPDVNVNGIFLNLIVRKNNIEKSQPLPSSQGPSGEGDPSYSTRQDLGYYRIYLTKMEDGLRVGQVKFLDDQMNEGLIEHKIYEHNFNFYREGSSIDKLEKGLFVSLLHSISFNSGNQLLNFLKTQQVPVRFNNEIINREKVELLTEYKKYLVKINHDRLARKNESNPLSPKDPAARARVNSIMASSMYADTNQVKFSKEDGEMSWLVDAGAFTAAINDTTRNLYRITFKSVGGEFEVICKDYRKPNGVHSFPRLLLIRTLSGDEYEVEISSIRYVQEKDEDITRRLRVWEKNVVGKKMNVPRPEFLL